MKMDSLERIPPEAQIAGEKRRFDWLSALQLGLGGLATLTLVSFSTLMGLGFGFLLIDEGGKEALPALWATAAALLFSGILVMISAGSAGWRLVKPDQRLPLIPDGVSRWMSAYRWSALIPFVWLAAALLPESGTAAALLFPLVNILGITLPVWLVVSLARRGLPAGGAQRQWGLFTTGMVFATVPILVLELMAAAVLIVSLMLLHPDLMQALTGFIENNSSPEFFELEYLLSSYIEEGEALAYVGIYIAGLVPIIEELLKPIGVWLLAGRKLTPAAGFTAGALSGAGFALFESLLGSTDPALWPNAMLARAGTAAMHTLATGISGWGLAQAFTNRRYGRAALSFIAAVGLHGAWNAVPVLIGAATLSREANSASFDLAQLEAAATGLFAIMGLAALALLVYINRRLAGGSEAGAPWGEEAAAGTTNRE